MHRSQASKKGQECPHHCRGLRAPIQPGGTKKDCFQRQREMVVTHLLLLKESWGRGGEMTWLDSDACVPTQTSDGGGTLATGPPGFGVCL